MCFIFLGIVLNVAEQVQGSGFRLLYHDCLSIVGYEGQFFRLLHSRRNNRVGVGFCPHSVELYIALNIMTPNIGCYRVGALKLKGST